MKKIEDNELTNINGGISGWFVAGVGLIVTFIAGVVDGIARPSKCHN